MPDNCFRSLHAYRSLHIIRVIIQDPRKMHILCLPTTHWPPPPSPGWSLLVSQVKSSNNMPFLQFKGVCVHKI